MGVDLKIIKIINKFLLKNIKVDFTFLNIVNKKKFISETKTKKILK